MMEKSDKKEEKIQKEENIIQKVEEKTKEEKKEEEKKEEEKKEEKKEPLSIFSKASTNSIFAQPSATSNPFPAQSTEIAKTNPFAGPAADIPKTTLFGTSSTSLFGGKVNEMLTQQLTLNK
jgi:outer membrane biosynthesis protein TonB